MAQCRAVIRRGRSVLILGLVGKGRAVRSGSGGMGMDTVFVHRVVYFVCCAHGS